jgi:hypothetical protein
MRRQPLATDLNPLQCKGFLVVRPGVGIGGFIVNHSQEASPAIIACASSAQAGHKAGGRVTVGPGRCQGRALGSRAGHQGREAVDGLPQVVQLRAAVDRHRQARVAVAGELHRLLEGRTAPVEQRDVAVPEAVEVGVQGAVGALDDVAHAGRFQVHP